MCVDVSETGQDTRFALTYLRVCQCAIEKKLALLLRCVNTSIHPPIPNLRVGARPHGSITALNPRNDFRKIGWRARVERASRMPPNAASRQGPIVAPTRHSEFCPRPPLFRPS